MVGLLESHGRGLAPRSLGFLNSREYLSGDRGFDDHIAVLYFTFLGRRPSIPEVRAWLRVLSVQLEAIQDGFVYSPEFIRLVESFR